MSDLKKGQIPWDKKQLNRANREAVKIIQRIIKTKSRSSDGKRIQKRTGNLLRNIKPIFKVKNNQLVIDVEVMEYYQYLDEGTRRIKPWFLTEEIMEDEEFLEIIEDLATDSLEGAIVDAVSKIKVR